MGKIYKIGSANFASQTGRAATTVGRVLKSWHKLKKGNVPQRTGSVSADLTRAGRSAHFRFAFGFCGDRSAGKAHFLPPGKGSVHFDH